MFHLYDVQTDEGPVKMVAALPPDTAVASGLPSPAVVGTIPVDAESISLENFSENSEFSDFLNYVIAKHGADDPALRAQAEAQGDGWVYMVDLRVADEESDEDGVESVDTEDILGAFRVEGGIVVEGSYRGNPNHRLLSERGLVRVDGWVEEKLVEELLALG